MGGWGHAPCVQQRHHHDEQAATPSASLTEADGDAREGHHAPPAGQPDGSSSMGPRRSRRRMLLVWAGTRPRALHPPGEAGDPTAARPPHTHPRPAHLLVSLPACATSFSNSTRVSLAKRRTCGAGEAARAAAGQQGEAQGGGSLLSTLCRLSSVSQQALGRRERADGR